jgi:hypothetical protein
MTCSCREALERIAAMDDAVPDYSGPPTVQGTIAREALAKPCGCKELRSERDAYRIEADEAMRDYEALEMDVRDVLGAIANPRPNQPFDPWARDTAQQALDRLDGDD